MELLGGGFSNKSHCKCFSHVKNSTPIWSIRNESVKNSLWDYVVWHFILFGFQNPPYNGWNNWKNQPFDQLYCPQSFIIPFLKQNGFMLLHRLAIALCLSLFVKFRSQLDGQFSSRMDCVPRSSHILGYCRWFMTIWIYLQFFCQVIVSFYIFLREQRNVTKKRKEKEKEMGDGEFVK